MSNGASRRRKGHNYEREVAKDLRDIYPEAARGQQTRDGTEAPDVDGTPYWIECKRGKKTNIKAAMRQAEAATDGRPVLAVCKDDYEEATVTLRLTHFKALLLEGKAPRSEPCAQGEACDDACKKIRFQIGDQLRVLANTVENL